MKSLPTLLCSALLVLAAPAAFAQHDHHAGPDAAKSADHTAPAASTNPADYPLQTCVVSGEELDSMGKPVDYIHKEAGKPDRLVRFCCDDCVKKFKKNPAKYLKKLDEAAAAKSAGHAEPKP